MNKIIFPALVATLALGAAAPVLASEGQVFEYSIAAATQDIAAQGFDVQDVEEWGSYVVATVIDDQGHTSFKYFDPDTLKLVR